jgi:hypothetical protein
MVSRFFKISRIKEAQCLTCVLSKRTTRKCTMGIKGGVLVYGKPRMMPIGKVVAPRMTPCPWINLGKTRLVLMKQMVDAFKLTTSVWIVQ